MKKFMIQLLILSLALISAGCGAVFYKSTHDLNLSKNGRTDYVIVKPDKPTKVDGYSITKLADFMKEKTGADFPVVSSDKLPKGKKYIFVGLSKPALKILGKNPLASLKDQEHIAKSVDGDIFLYGKGKHGNMYAVFDFMENVLGWRWYSQFEEPTFDVERDLTIKSFDRKQKFSFAYRRLYPREFSYNHGANMGFSEHNVKIKKRYGANCKWLFQSGVESFKYNASGVHTLFRYIPPGPEYRIKPYDFIKNKNYFKSNPEFFSMNAKGKRASNRQLCFSNPGLRRELTKNILKHIHSEGDNIIISLDANDNPGKFCYCPECIKLEEQYNSPGGPIYDYLIELCKKLKKEHPKVMVKTLAYRRSQTQKPPILPNGEKLPDNLIIDFAPIEDSYFADWTHPDPKIQETYQDLKNWGKICKNLQVWIYPNPWGTGETMPVGNVERLINEVRLMKKAGASGVFADHNGIHDRSGFSELQTYLLCKLMQNTDCDTNAIIMDFTDHMYGAAAPLMRKYLTELENGRKKMNKLPPKVTYISRRFDNKTFPYLTPENIHRWQLMFDAMEEKVKNNPAELSNVRLLRRELDFATLWKWFALKKKYPDYYSDYKVFANRIKAANKTKNSKGKGIRSLGKGALSDFVAIIQGGGKEKPLPKFFKNIDKSKIRTFVPSNTAKIPDKDAAFGYGVDIDKPDYPFQLGFFQWLQKNPPKGNQGARLKLDKKQIVPGVYTLYKLGKIVISPDCIIWFSAKSWKTNIELGDRIYEPGEDNKWNAYVSLKFDGPSYGGKAKKDQVLCDRIILVKKF